MQHNVNKVNQSEKMEKSKLGIRDTTSNDVAQWNNGPELRANFMISLSEFFHILHLIFGHILFYIYEKLKNTSFK